jgi:hypothetical protein
MPWTGATFKSRHNHGLSGAGSAQAASVANAILRDTGDEGKAIRIANWQAKRRDAGGIATAGDPSAFQNLLLANQQTASDEQQDAADDQYLRGLAPANVAHAASGGIQQGFQQVKPFKPPNLTPPYAARQAARQLHTGAVMSSVPGRVDAHKIRVPSGSYVLPAETVSGMGQGNTVAGLKRAHEIFGMGPYGTALQHVPHGRGQFPNVHQQKVFAYGGYSEGGPREGDHFHPVDVDVSGGEYIIHPAAIIKEFGSLKHGHQILDHFVMRHRKQHIKILQNLPGPAKRWMGGGVWATHERNPQCMV